MKDQVTALKTDGVKAAFINSSAEFRTDPARLQAHTEDQFKII
jgi:superfamily II DNA helicase RecQ